MGKEMKKEKKTEGDSPAAFRESVSFWKQTLAEFFLSREGCPETAEPALPEELLTEGLPPSEDRGDLAFPLFPLAKIFRCSPALLAKEAAESLGSSHPEQGCCRAEGGYLNVFYNRSRLSLRLLSRLYAEGENYGKNRIFDGEKILVEFSSPNTNKPLHLGHLRNDILGESLARILGFSGADVVKVSIINDRGVHICKSMAAYQREGKGETPESTGKKGDHLVGDYYVAFNNWSKTDPEAEKTAQKMLHAWEAGDPETRALWAKMRQWVLDGIRETYRKTGISFDKYYFESETYLLGKGEVERGLEQGLFFRDDRGAVLLDMGEIGLDSKVFLRSDGTSVYIVQDLGTAIERHKDFSFDRMIYVVGSEQDYHFKALFYALKKLGFPWAEKLFHLSYGMVNLPEGKMKSREGTVVDADVLLEELETMVGEESAEKPAPDSREERDGEASPDEPRERSRDPETAADIALGALHYYLLQVSPRKDMIFDPKKSLALTGDTGVYLQYVGARIAGIKKKIQKEAALPPVESFLEQQRNRAEVSFPDHESEWVLIKRLAVFPSVVENAAREYNPGKLAGYLYLLSKDFSRFYHDCPILSCRNQELKTFRFALIGGVERVLKQGFQLLNIPYRERM